MNTLYLKNSDGRLVRHSMDLDAYYCMWRRAWVAFDHNEDGEECQLVGQGTTRDEAVADLLDQLEERLA